MSGQVIMSLVLSMRNLKFKAMWWMKKNLGQPSPCAESQFCIHCLSTLSSRSVSMSSHPPSPCCFQPSPQSRAEYEGDFDVVLVVCCLLGEKSLRYSCVSLLRKLSNIWIYLHVSGELIHAPISPWFGCVWMGRGAEGGSTRDWVSLPLVPI